MTRLDYADLCAIETTMILRPDVFDDTVRDLVQALVDNLKAARDETAEAESALEAEKAKTVSVLDYVDDASREVTNLQGSDETSRAVDKRLNDIDDMLRDAKRAGQ